MDALFADDSEEATRLANEARTGVRAIDERVRAIDELLRDLIPPARNCSGWSSTPVLRSADYGGNVAETALQKAAPTP